MEFCCQHLSHGFRTRTGELVVLRDINCTVAQQEFVSLVGPSGCGKTTLLKLIAGLLKPTNGHIVFGAMGEHGRPPNAMVFQDHGLLPWLTVLDNAALGLEMQGIRRQERHAQARAFLEQIGLGRFAGYYPHQLSMGMRQRTAIARAFLAPPQLLLMDEPFSALDAQTKVLLQEELLRLWSEYRKTVVYVTHDIDEAIVLSDRILVMTGHPGWIRADLPVPLPRPRQVITRNMPEVKELRWQIWNIIEEEVRLSLSGNSTPPRQ
jgi:NitT/TauT family transport system ATP-binding protein